jgi:hypothetical protein
MSRQFIASLLAVRAEGRRPAERERIQAAEATGPAKAPMEPEMSQAMPTRSGGAGTRRLSITHGHLASLRSGQTSQRIARWPLQHTPIRPCDFCPMLPRLQAYWSRPLSRHVCSAFARMPWYSPVVSGITRHRVCRPAARTGRSQHFPAQSGTTRAAGLCPLCALATWPMGHHVFLTIPLLPCAAVPLRCRFGHQGTDQPRCADMAASVRVPEAAAARAAGRACAGRSRRVTWPR